jgi:hypothetical protein
MHLRVRSGAKSTGLEMSVNGRNRSFDHLVGAQQNRRPDRDAEFGHDQPVALR